MIFYFDDFFILKKPSEYALLKSWEYFRNTINLPSSATQARRFFLIAAQLPMDLQMVLANRTAGLHHTLFIRSEFSESAFRRLAISVGQQFSQKLNELTFKRLCGTIELH